MTATRTAPDPPRRRRGLLGRSARALDPRQLALIRFQLTPGQKAEMWARGTALGQIAVLVGSSVYFLFIQRAYGFHDPAGPWNTVIWNKDFYDRFVIHVQNGLPGICAVLAGLAVAAAAAWLLAGPVLRLRHARHDVTELERDGVTQAEDPVLRRARRRYRVRAAVTAAGTLAAGTAAALLTARQLAGWHVHWFPGQSAPPWYVAARHQFRHFLIGAIAAVMVSSVTIGLGKRARKRVPNWAIPVRFAVAFITAVPVAAVPIGLFAWVLPHVLGWDAARIGLVVGNGDGQIIAAVTVAAAGVILAVIACKWARAPLWLLAAAALLAGAGLYAAVAYLMPRYGVSLAPFGRGAGTLAGQWIGEGAWEATLTGVATGLAMKPIMRPAQDTLQLISIENKMTGNQVIGDDGTVSYASPPAWWRWVYGAAYVNRYRYCVAEGHQPARHGAVMGALMALAVPAGLYLVINGIWLLWLGGPATGVH